ncbi:IS4/Tn5 family transposase DNA-binding protein [Paraburkholderia fungorum]|uniref:IS4/Tn5 family transposase DNA-binding protein n=1 Tax=Paraburkholderia fungorum TaxID=134537 RepID=UPI0020A8214F|nr:transposase DNA-binding-containing protein [Paraburkholderia fungorum]
MAKKERADEQAWFEKEIEASKFQDARLRKRFGMVLERLWSGIGQTIPFACQDWSSTKVAYRFLSNERVSEQEILSGHFHASAKRFRSTRGPILSVRSGVLDGFVTALGMFMTGAPPRDATGFASE